MGVEWQSLEDAILRTLAEHPEDARGLARRLQAAGIASCDKSQVNSVLYRLERDSQVRRLGSTPPLWVVINARPSRSTKVGKSATGDTAATTGSKKDEKAARNIGNSTGSSLKETAQRLGRPQSRQGPGSPASSNSAGDDTGAAEAGVVWQAAVKHLAKGRSLHRNNLVSLIQHDTGLGAAIVEHLTAGFAGVATDGVYFDIRPEHRLVLTLKAQLPDLTQTPAGHLRTGSIRLDAKGPAGALSARFEVVDDETSYWFCCRASDPHSWASLYRGAETVSAGWALPLGPAPADQLLPAPLIWRNAELLGAVRAACATAAALGASAFDTVRLTSLPAPVRPVTLRNTDQETVARITRRRGVIPAGRKYPIQGSCDRCGQPLSDPYSLLVGVGPVCRGYYSPHVLAAVARAREPVAGPSATGRARTPADAVARLAADWR